MLNMDLYVVFTKPTNVLGPVGKYWGTFKISNFLRGKGCYIGASPFWEDNEIDWASEGMVIIRANSLSEANEIAATDPMHKSGARSFTVWPWLLNEGTINLSVNYSKRNLTLK